MERPEEEQVLEEDEVLAEDSLADGEVTETELKEQLADGRG